MNSFITWFQTARIGGHIFRRHLSMKSCMPARLTVWWRYASERSRRYVVQCIPFGLVTIGLVRSPPAPSFLRILRSRRIARSATDSH